MQHLLLRYSLAIVIILLLPRSLHSEEETGIKPPGFAGYFKFVGVTNSKDQNFIPEQLSRFQSSNTLPRGFEGILAFGAGYKYIFIEAEVGQNGGTANFFGGSHEMELTRFFTTYWLRGRFSKPFNIWKLPLYSAISPGAAVGYTTAELISYDKENKTDGGKIESSAQLLYGSGVTYAVGVHLETGYRYMYPASDDVTMLGIAIVFDYRYRFAKMPDTEALNGGEFYFPDNPEFDYSGNTFAIGINIFIY